MTKPKFVRSKSFSGGDSRNPYTKAAWLARSLGDGDQPAVDSGSLPPAERCLHDNQIMRSKVADEHIAPVLREFDKLEKAGAIKCADVFGRFPSVVLKNGKLSMRSMCLESVAIGPTALYVNLKESAGLFGTAVGAP